MDETQIPEGFEQMLQFGLVEALLGRRSRRFFMGAEIPDGVFTYESSFDPAPLTKLEKLLVVTACGGNTGWHNMIYRAARYAPHLSSYAGAGGGRTFPSAAGFHTSVTFFTDDDGTYLLDNRDAPAYAQPDEEGRQNLPTLVETLEQHISQLDDQRLQISSKPPHVEAHNTWVANKPGTLLVIPAGDLAQHVILALTYLLQNGAVITDDINGRHVPGIEAYDDLYDEGEFFPLTFLEQQSMTELTAELSTSCYAGHLMLQAMGLGGWLFNGINPFSVLGASGDPEVPGLGFRYDERDDWPYPNPTGLEGRMEATTPPHYEDMRAAVDAVQERKFGHGGPFHPETPGPWKDSTKVRGAAEPHSEHFLDCVALQAQYIYDTFGKFPGTVPSVFVMPYLQAHHLDLDFYDEFYQRGAYLQTHSEHMDKWHGGTPPRRG